MTNLLGNLTRRMRTNPRRWYSLQNTELWRAFGLRTTGTQVYQETYAFLEQSQAWSRNQMERYQLQMATKLLAHAYEHVPFYRAKFDSVGFEPAEFTALPQLRHLPFLEKNDLLHSLDSLKATDASPERFQYVTSGGSTGVPVGFFLDSNYTAAARDAFFARMQSAAGVKPYLRGVVIRGAAVNSASKEIATSFDVFSNKLYVSSYHLKNDNLGDFYKILRKYRPVTIQAYPSAITPIAQYMIEEDLPRIDSVRVVLCGSENIYDWQRVAIERAFQCRLFVWYGHSENVVLAGPCEVSNEYHVYGEHGIAELIREDGSSIEGDDEVGEIVGTGFLNSVMPFVRYRTGDSASWASGQCECGREYRRLRRIEGRLQELAVTQDGRLVSMAAINMHSDLFDRVLQFQFVQEQAGTIRMNVVRRPTYTEADSVRIRQGLAAKFGDGMEIQLEFVSSILPGGGGKHRFLIQKLKVDGHDQ